MIERENLAVKYADDLPKQRLGNNVKKKKLQLDCSPVVYHQK